MTEMRKITEDLNICELGLKGMIADKLIARGHTAQDVVMATRLGRLMELEGVGEVTARKIHEAVEEAGFLLHESESSRAIRRLLLRLFDREVTTTEQYEAQVRFNAGQHHDFGKVLKTLKPREVDVLKMRAGLDGMPRMTLREIAEKLELSIERVHYIADTGMRLLRQRSRAKQLREIFADFLDTLGVPEFDEEVQVVPKTSIDKLNLGTRARNCLTRAGITNLEQLRRMPFEDLVRVRNLGLQCLLEIQTAMYWSIINKR